LHFLSSVELHRCIALFLLESITIIYKILDNSK
jgi:hypothetical protein